MAEKKKITVLAGRNRFSYVTIDLSQFITTDEAANDFLTKQAIIEAPVVSEDEVDYTVGVKDGQIVLMPSAYIDVPEGDIELDQQGDAATVDVNSNTSWDIE